MQDSLEEQFAQGSFVGYGRQDVLTTVIRLPVHIGCVRVAGASVTTRQYFGQASTGSHTSTSISPKELDQMKQNIKEELPQNIKEKLK